ncbi:uncharacterized protein N7473_002666 [Penicillium subrubescens]|uniref:Uncharacterized protein n=1 Tax=Penicillium subrubescens TaxID=1316194 RepID=A0A1Q5UKR0_9EURO|nr:uncharacterized protein N7473_002666 [Penicillium subrubescens]KAJ5905750.1 hypothetical protein N7473_002666 [Penicillium subrubescens]OKP13068.1 hypothetical protein PENSUB_1168 [Penicillium subrubescens]
MSTTNKPTPGESPRPQSKGTGSALMAGSLVKPPYNPYAWFEGDNLSPTQAALRMSNEHLERRLIKLQVNSARLQRELLLLQQHIKEFHHPLFETWEADILTRFIEVAHAYQARKLATGVSIGEDNVAERECISRGYVNAAKHVEEETVERLGLSEKYHQALLRYEEVAAYRSPNPFQTETPFARWLIEEKENRPEKYAFWSKLYPVCYGRSVERSASMF